MAVKPDFLKVPMLRDGLFALLLALPLSVLGWLALVFGPAWTEPYQVANIPLGKYFFMSATEKVDYLNASNLADQTVSGFAKLGYLVAASPLPYFIYWLLILAALLLMYAAGVVKTKRSSGLTVD